MKGQLGHTDAALTLAYYAREMDRSDGEPDRLKALVEGNIKAVIGSSDVGGAIIEVAGDAEKPIDSGLKRP